MLKKPHFLWCERTAKISHLFQSCKSFFKNFASSEKFVFTSGFELLYCKLSVFVRTTVFLKRGCKGSDFFRTCKCFDVFFRKIFKNDLSIPCYLFIYNEKRSGCLRKGRRRHSAGVAKPATASEIAAAGDADELARNPRIPPRLVPKDRPTVSERDKRQFDRKATLIRVGKVIRRIESIGICLPPPKQGPEFAKLASQPEHRTRIAVLLMAGTSHASPHPSIYASKPQNHLSIRDL